jgi:hypothetical protein
MPAALVMILLAWVSRISTAAELPSSKHALGDVVHDGLHGKPLWKSVDGSRAVHNFSWSDAAGRDVNLAYDIEHAAAVHQLDDLHLVAMETDTNETKCLLTFESEDESTAFALQLEADASYGGSVLVGGPSWVSKGIDSPAARHKLGKMTSLVATGVMLRVQEVLLKEEATLILRVHRCDVTDLFRHARIRFSHKVLPHDLDHHAPSADNRAMFNKTMPYLNRETNNRSHKSISPACTWKDPVCLCTNRTLVSIHAPSHPPRHCHRHATLYSFGLVDFLKIAPIYWR